MCIQKGSTFCFGSVFSNTHHGPFTSFPGAIFGNERHGWEPRPEPMAKWVDEAMALCMPLCGIAKEEFAVKNGDENRCRNGGFLKWWYPTTMGFPTKNDHFGEFWGYHHLRKHK